MAHLEISLLGTVNIARDGQPVSTPAYAKVLGLLAYLAVESDRAHQRSSIAALFWPEQSEERARHSLRQALSTLRRVTADHTATPPHLLINRETIAFNRESDHVVDVDVFRDLLSTSDHHHHHRVESCGPCIQRFERALTCYRGDFLDGFSVGDSVAFEDWLHLWRQRLRDQVVHALEAMAAYYDEHGEQERAIEALQRHLELDTWNEEVHRRLMLALWRDGQRSAALAQYERCRAVLDEELGVEPEEETSALYEQIRAPDQQPPEARSSTAKKSHLPRLPVPQTRLVGRARENEEIADLLAHRDCRLLTLTGPGGIGKTRIAIEVATDHARQQTDAVYFVQLASLRDQEGILPAIAEELGVTLLGSQRPEDQLVDWLRDRSVFLVLDNVEHLLDGMPVVSGMLAKLPTMTVLATSRERLNLHGEWVYEVGGLGVPRASETDRFEGYGAVELFTERLRQVRSGMPLRHEERPYIVRICQLVDGMPLALEMAAAWASTLTLDQIEDEIRRNLDFLSTTMRDLPDRHRSMRAVFRQSWEMLTAEEQAAYRKLSVFQDGFQRDAAEHATDTSALQLAALIGKSLLAQQGNGRYRVHEVLRQYADELLRQEEREYRELHDRHCRYYLDLLACREEALTGKDQQAALSRIEDDIGNIRSAWSWALEHGMFEDIARAAHAFWLFYVIRGWMREGATTFGDEVRALKSALETGAPNTPQMRLALAMAKMHHGGFQSGLGRYDDGIDLLTRSIEMFRELGAEWHVGLALNMLAAAHNMKGEFRRALELLEQSLAHFRNIGHSWGIAFSMNDLGLVSYLLDELDDAERFCEESRVMFRRIGDRRGHAFAAYNLGMIEARRGHYERARRLYRESLSMREHSHDRWGIGASLVQLANVVRQLGEREEARDYLLKALGITWNSSVTPVVLDVLVEMSAFEADGGDEKWARTTLAAVAAHPALHGHVRKRLEHLMRAIDMDPMADSGYDDRWAVETVDNLARSLIG